MQTEWESLGWQLNSIISEVRVYSNFVRVKRIWKPDLIKRPIELLLEIENETIRLKIENETIRVPVYIKEELNET